MRHLNYRGQVTGETGLQRAENARIEAEYALALKPNDPEAHITMAWALISGGKPQEGLDFVKTAKRLNPSYPSNYAYFEAAARIGMGDLILAASILKQEIISNRYAVELASLAASVNAQLGNRQEARKSIELWLSAKNQVDL